MSNNLAVPNQLKDLVRTAEAGFSKIVKATGNGMIFQNEALYAMQAMLSSDALATAARSNPISFNLAMSQIASSGLTLNPSMGLAYLVPRQGRVIADISYRGLIKIATDTRAVELVVPEAVYSNDVFRYRGSNQEPVHEFDPFMDKADRGEFRGVYVKAYLAIGSLLVTAVSSEEIYKARDLSTSWIRGQVGKKGPWESHPYQMGLKAGIKFARKFWPMTSPVLEQVISYLNDEAGEGFSPQSVSLDIANRELELPKNVVDLPLQMADIEPVAQPVDGTVVSEQPARPAAPSAAPAARQDNQQSQAPESSPIGAQGSEVDVDPKMIARIKSVLARCVRLQSWEAGYDWVNNHTSGSDYEFAIKLFDQERPPQSLKKTG